MASRFLFNESLWAELEARVPKAKLTRAAVAYFGSGGSKLLRLKKGDRLVVDMSLKAVRAGATDPHEVRKLLRKGVQVFSRAGLHAKFFVIDRVVIAGSANISKNARYCLDEAAILTDDPATLRRATSVFDQLCTEFVRKHYLERCISEYRPPSFVPGRGAQTTNRRRLKQGKLWIIGGLRYLDIPKSEGRKASDVVKKAEKRLLDYERSEVDYSHYPSRLRFFDQVQLGDQLIVCIRSERGFDVYPPARCLGIESYPRGGGKKRYLLLRNSPTDAKTVSWSQLRRSLSSSVRIAGWAKPRTSSIVDDAEADAILGLWDPITGRWKGSKRSKR